MKRVVVVLTVPLLIWCAVIEIPLLAAIFFGKSSSGETAAGMHLAVGFAGALTISAIFGLLLLIFQKADYFLIALSIYFGAGNGLIAGALALWSGMVIGPDPMYGNDFALGLAMHVLIAMAWIMKLIAVALIYGIVRGIWAIHRRSKS